MSHLISTPDERLSNSHRDDARRCRHAFVEAVLVCIAVLQPATAHAQPASLTTPAEYLASLPRPDFKAGHSLPRLSRYGWALPLTARIELAEHWNYALEFGSISAGACYVTEAVVKRLDDPSSDEAKLAALAKREPAKFPLAVICTRELPTNVPPETWVRDAAGRFLEAKAHSLDGNTWHPELRTVFSPLAPDVVWKEAGAIRAQPLVALIARGLPIAIVLNGGEYGLGVPGALQNAWQLDPRIVTARGTQSWAGFASQRKGQAERMIADEVRGAVPDRQLYVYYTAGGGTLRNKDRFAAEWGFDFDSMRSASDLPSNEIYYRHFNDGFTGRLDVLTLALNAAAREIAAGAPHSYNWVSGGWPRGDAKQATGKLTTDAKADEAELRRWTGFLTCYFAAGMLGCNTGYYAYPPDGFAAQFPAAQPPAWLHQLTAAAYAQARMSHVEDLLRDGDLLAGPARHAISTDDPAYEFPTGNATARVLVRKSRKRAEWLVTAWAAAGPDREVTVAVPELGRVTLAATGEATVCRIQSVDGRPRIEYVVSQLPPDLVAP